MAEEMILEKIEGHVCTLTLNRPDRLNALSLELIGNLSKKLDTFGEQDSTRLVVLRGAGRAFSAGGDLKIIRQNPTFSHKIYDEISRHLNEIIEKIKTRAQVFVGVLQGPAYGAGFGLALACDLLVATPQATLCPSFINLALAPNGATTYLLPRLLGPKAAMEAFLTARVFDAEEAYQRGIVNRLWPQNDLEKNLQALIADILRRSPKTIGRIKKLMASSFVQDLSHQIQLERKEIAASAGDEEFNREVEAFFERKKQQ